MNEPRTAPTGFSRVANIFMIVAFAIGAFYIVSFVTVYPKYWYAAVLFLVIAIVGIIKRVAVLRGTLPAHRAPDPTDTDH